MKALSSFCRIALALLLTGLATTARAGTSTAISSGNWSNAGIWSSSPAGFAPNNGNNGENWSATVNSGTITLDTAIIIQSLALGGGTIDGTNSLTLNQLSTFTGGTMTGAGTTLANGGVTFNGTNMSVNGGRNLSIGGAGVVTSQWTSGTLRVTTGGTVRVASGGNLELTFDGTVDSNGFASTGHFTIDAGGTFTKSGGALTATIGTGSGGNDGFNVAEVTFNNNGVTNVNSGTLSLIGGGTSTGTFNIAANSTLSLGGGGPGTTGTHTHNFNAGTIMQGAGTLVLAGGVPTFASGTTYNLGATQVTGSTVSFNGTASSRVLNMSGGTTTITGALSLGDGSSSLNSAWSGGSLTLNNSGTLTNTAGSTLTTTFGGTLGVSGTGTKTFSNAGAFTKSGATATTTTINSVFNNAGTVNANSGTLTLSGGVTQHSGTTLTGGTWNVTNGAAINITTGSNITTIGSGGTVMLDGAGSSFAKVTDALATNQGSFTIKNDRDLTTSGAYTNSGTTRVEDGTTTMTIGAGGSAAYTQTGGVTALVNGAFIDPSVFNLNGGALQGTGTIESSVIAGPGSNTIAPGLSPGALTINGSLTLSSGSTLAMELGGLSQGTLYDYLDVNGVLTLAGMLDLDFINGFETGLPSGELLTLATANSAILGSFSNVASGGYLMTNFPIALQVFYGAGSPYGAENLVVAIPEPSRALLMMLGMTGLMLRRRRVV